MSTLRTSNLIHGSSAVSNVVLDTAGRALFGPDGPNGRSALYVNPQNNRVGVNTEAPTATLTVDGTISTTGDISIGGTINLTGALSINTLNASSGTAAAPSVSVGTTDNGLYSPGTDQVAISTNGTERMRLDSSGNVGIGGNGIGNGLGVFLRKSSPATTNFYEASDGTKTMITGVDSSNDYVKIGSLSNHAVGFVTNNNERMRIDSSGNVGIGTTSPEYIFDTRGSINISGSIFRRAADNTTFSITNRAAQPLVFGTNDTERMRIYGSDGGVSLKAYLEFANQAGNGFSGYIGNGADVIASGSSADLGVRSQQNLIFAAGGANERMRIDSSGNVIVGSSATPDSQSILTVNDQGSTQGFVSFENRQNYGWGIGIKFRMPMVSNGSVVNSGRIYSGYEASGKSYMQFNTYDGASGGEFERMRISSLGTVMIGRTSVVGDEKLALQNTTGKCAYVFQGGNANHNCMELRNAYAQGGQTAQMIRFVQQSGGQVGQITSTTTATSYLSGASDRRLKKNIEDWTDDVLQHFKTLNPCKFNYLTEEDGDSKTKGYIAQDLAEVFPEAYPSLYYEDAEEDRYSYNPGGMVVYLMKALQEAAAKIETLEQRLSDAGIA